MEKKKHNMAVKTKIASHGKHHLTHADEVKGGKDSHKKEHHHSKKK